ncbi:PEGA domain-containing protein [Candidatus Parcubacteria bacterium]|nr:MAG: PEGA domain-containing protein [Candidatus Parcubacteria bacterium]
MKKNIGYIELIGVIILTVIIIKIFGYEKSKTNKIPEPTSIPTIISSIPTEVNVLKPSPTPVQIKNKDKNAHTVVFNTGGGHIVVVPWLPTPSYTVDLKQGDCSIHIVPNPYNAEVYFEDKHIGTGPGEVTGLSPGEYYISVSNSIYGTGDINVTVEEGLVHAIIEMKKDEQE